MSWHVAAEAMVAYRAGTLTASEVWSVEAHMTSCVDCRRHLAEEGGGTNLDVVWAGIADEISAPPRPALERVIVALGAPDHVARLLGATPSLTVPWLAAVAVAIGFAVAMAWSTGVDPVHSQRELLPFLLAAPLIPLAGVGAAFGPLVDPAYEIAIAAPIDKARLMLIRGVAVISTSMLLVGCGALFLPQPGWLALAWIVPALALTTVALVLSTVLAPVGAIALPAVAWIAGIIVMQQGSTRLVGFGAGTQLVMAAVLAVAVAVAVVRRGAFDIGARS